MHGVPVDLPLEPFVGCALDQVCLGSHQLQFHFSGERCTGGDRICVEGGWDLRDAACTEIDCDQGCSERRQYTVHVLLGRIVSSFTIDAPRSFQLLFDSGHRLTIYDDSKQYETFSVEPTGKAGVFI